MRFGDLERSPDAADSGIEDVGGFCKGVLDTYLVR